MVLKAYAKPDELKTRIMCNNFSEQHSEGFWLLSFLSLNKTKKPC